MGKNITNLAPYYTLATFYRGCLMMKRRPNMMKEKIKAIIALAAQKAHTRGDLPCADQPPLEVAEPKTAAHGDFATNFALVSASIQKMAPRKIAETLIQHIEDPDGLLDAVEIAGPGFINFKLNRSCWYPVLTQIHQEEDRYGRSDFGQGRRIQVEFVSSNPTGPLHVGHGRGAAVGDSTANILSHAGFDVQKEYYINDSGRQIQTLGRSVYLRYQALLGQTIDFPEDCYQGDYIRTLAAEIRNEKGDALLELPEPEGIMWCAKRAADAIIAGIRDDLADFGVTYDRWFSEQSLYDTGVMDATLEDLRQRDLVYDQEGALWFRTEQFGDEKDRVVVRTNGQTTYFASDIAYHYDKYGRGFDRVIDVWGADHHGYIPRVAAAIQAGGYERRQFDVILVQLVNLLRDGEPAAMSTRAGEFVTLADVVKEVGRDAARFIFLSRHHESALDFDLGVAKQKTNENPVFYVQYVHARIASIARKAKERGVASVDCDPSGLAVLSAPEEIDLIKNLSRYPEIVVRSAELMEPHRVAFYLMNLASAFHTYYNKHRVLGDDPLLTRARLYLVLSVQKVIHNGLTLLGVSAPEKM
jgi:arginyl-tRNA synthetase